jgi:hypothetical protein
MSEEEKSNEEEGKEEKEEEGEGKEKEENDEEEKKDDKKDKKKDKDKKNKKEKDKNEKTDKKADKNKEENGKNDNNDKNDKKQLTLSKENKPNLIPITNNLNDNNTNMTSRFPYYPLVPGQAQSSLQILSSINNDMDSLSKSLNSKFIGVTSSSSSSSPPLYNDNFNYNNAFPTFSTNNYNSYYDKEDYEIKELLIKAKQLIDNTDTKIKLNDIFNSANKKYENKLCQSGESNFKYLNNLNDNNNNFRNYDFNSNSNIYKNNKYNDYNQYRNKSINYNNNNNINSNINNYFNRNDNEDITEGYYRTEIPKTINQNYNNNKPFPVKDYIINNVPKMNNYNPNSNDNVIFKEYKHNKKYDDFSIEDSIINKTKKIEDLYKYTNNPRRKPMVYSQPDSIPIGLRQRNASVDSNNYNNNNYSVSRDNVFNKKKSYLRFDNDGVNRAIDILNGKI